MDDLTSSGPYPSQNQYTSYYYWNQKNIEIYDQVQKKPTKNLTTPKITSKVYFPGYIPDNNTLHMSHSVLGDNK